MQPTKVCTKCAVEKPATTEHFSPHARCRFGVLSACKPCMAAYSRGYYDQHRGECIARSRATTGARRLANPEIDRAYSREQKRRELQDPIRYQAHLEYGRQWRADNPGRVAQFKHMAPAARCARQAARAAAKLRATPPWSETQQIAAVYELASRMTESTGIEHQVDHIVPLRGKLVSGLHVLANLRVITADANRAKGNTFNDQTAAIAAA